MKDRKLHVIKMSHQLFIEKGFLATSIQDILNYSGISKGTFYNYFSSKNELLMELFKSIYIKLEKERNDLLIGQSADDLDIFIQQIELQVATNRSNKLLTLFDEVVVLHDEDLKEFFHRGQLRMLRWYYQRFIDLFGEENKTYLLDCTIMFIGILHQNLKYHAFAFEGSDANLHSVVQYSVNRIVRVVEEAAESREQLFDYELIDQWMPDFRDQDPDFQKELHHAILSMKQQPLCDTPRYTELLEFIRDEMLHHPKPRRFLVESAMDTLRQNDRFSEEALDKLNLLIHSFFD
ncbi:TetR/AcrR family transcriptional regulator [Rossellomorea marisflavi]|uniref:TetR/AcrR family transcriptional regulator n=1 Tax=Rossellomorea marisflavi TaxID=189381 RepID=UPI003AEBBD62